MLHNEDVYLPKCLLLMGMYSEDTKCVDFLLTNCYLSTNKSNVRSDVNVSAERHIT